MPSPPSLRLFSLWAVGALSMAAVFSSASLVSARPATSVYSSSERDDAFFLRFKSPMVFALVPPVAFSVLQDGQTMEDILHRTAEETVSYGDARGEGSYSVTVGDERVTRVFFDAAALRLAFYPSDSQPFVFQLGAFGLAQPQVRLWVSGQSLVVVVVDEPKRVVLRFSVPRSRPDPDRDVSVTAYRDPDRSAARSTGAGIDDDTARGLYQSLVGVPQLHAGASTTPEHVALEAAMQVFSAVLRSSVEDESRYLEARAAGLDPGEWILRDFLQAYIVALHAMLETVSLAAEGLPPDERSGLVARARLLASALLMRPYMVLSGKDSLAAIDAIIAAPSTGKFAELRTLIDHHELLAEFTSLWNQLGRHLSIQPHK